MRPCVFPIRGASNTVWREISLIPLNTKIGLKTINETLIILIIPHYIKQIIIISSIETITGRQDIEALRRYNLIKTVNIVICFLIIMSILRNRFVFCTYIIYKVLRIIVIDLLLTRFVIPNYVLCCDDLPEKIKNKNK